MYMYLLARARRLSLYMYTVHMESSGALYNSRMSHDMMTCSEPWFTQLATCHVMTLIYYLLSINLLGIINYNINLKVFASFIVNKMCNHTDQTHPNPDHC